jgi:hypothetical protein
MPLSPAESELYLVASSSLMSVKSTELGDRTNL